MVNCATSSASSSPSSFTIRSNSRGFTSPNPNSIARWRMSNMMLCPRCMYLDILESVLDITWMALRSLTKGEEAPCAGRPAPLAARDPTATSSSFGAPNGMASAGSRREGSSMIALISSVTSCPAPMFSSTPRTSPHCPLSAPNSSFIASRALVRSLLYMQGSSMEKRRAKKHATRSGESAAITCLTPTKSLPRRRSRQASSASWMRVAGSRTLVPVSVSPLP
mmetsp:Transcript_57391/g.181679  ORF Transcript_57391/g.181679 Transcript_57391/m.181679 type:complete len:223 (+) Transcript_57391:576-1244(+)